ncbi:MAG: C-terminal binding protein [Geminicoccaceae bacterium]|nr:MAG: C-terminal binding protein [Geminicoccaceae bacterium]
MRILIIDPQFDDEPDVERAVTGPEADLVIWRTDRQGAVPDAELAACDALVICRSRTRLDAEHVALMGRCRIVSQSGVGFNHIDIDSCGAAGIPVCNSPDYGTMEVADHAVALALALSRGIVAYDRKLRDRRMGWHAREQGTVRRIYGRHFGIVGLGRIGLAAALRAQGFGLHIHFVDPYLPPGIERALGFTRHSTLAALLATVDVVSIHTPLTVETREMIDAAALAAAKPGLVLVNTARGPICDLDALYDGLRDGRLGGVGLDVLPVEPMTYEHPLVQAWAADEPWLDGRMIVTPHAAFYSPDGLLDMRRIALENVVDYLRHGTLRTCVNHAAMRRNRGH